MTTLAGNLARAFGDIDTMKKLYHPDIVWKLSESLGPNKGPYDGIDAVLEFNERVWGKSTILNVRSIFWMNWVMTNLARSGFCTPLNCAELTNRIPSST